MFFFLAYFIWISSNEVDETGAYYTEWSKPDFIFLGSKIPANGDCSHEIKTLAPWKKSYDKPRHIVEKAMAPHSSSLAWKIPWMEEPGELQSMGSLWVRHDWVTSLSFSLSCIGEGHGNLLQCPCLENPRDEGAWWVAVYGVAQSWTRLKRLSSSSSRQGE